MTITEELDALRAALPGCETVAYADLAAGLVLCVAVAGRVRQERLDALCLRCTGLLHGPGAAAAGAAVGAPQIDWAVALQPLGWLAVLRAPDEPDEALCLTGRQDIDIAGVLAQGREALARIGAAG